MTRGRARWALAAAALVAACGDGGSGPPSCLPDCAANRAYDAVGYELRARYDWDAQRLLASEDITLTVSAPAFSVVELDSTVDVSSVHAGAQLLAFSVDTDAEVVRVDLGPLAPGADPVTFTVDYEAAPSSSLIAALPRDDDPVASRMVYTDSEPRRGHRWLVEKDDPSDRATWAVELTVAADEDVIANGARVSDQPSGSDRVVRYQMDLPIPTYLMAFAAGQIEHTDRPDGSSVPLAVWYRRGLAVDPDRTLDVVAGAMATFEALIGPYRWDSYAVVLVPLYGGGMENASITFNLEESGQGNVGIGLNAHELGHQWFGDWITMRGYDDVWFKEGMATLLASEAERAERDGGSVPRKFGTDFSFNARDAIVDSTLTGLSKYTSGPYERAAWTITQIRVRVGEEAFWGSLRQLLDDHALESIDGETFLRAFSPALDDATIDKLLAALPQTDVPVIDIATAPTDGGTEVTLSMSDPAGVLINPIGITVVGSSGQATTSMLDTAAPLTVTVPDGGYLAPDEADEQPYWSYSFQVDYDVYYNQLVPLFLPAAPAAIEAFTGRSAAVQERTLTEGAGLPVGADELDGFVADLDSTFAQEMATFTACQAVLFGGEGDWAAALAPLLATPSVQVFSPRYGDCGAGLGAALAPELGELAGATDPDALARTEYLISLDYGADSFAPISALATSTPSLELRDLAIDRLGLQTQGRYPSGVPAEQVEAWKTFFRDRLAETTSSRRFGLVWLGVLGLGDVEALPLTADALHRIPLSEQTQRNTICDVYAIAQQRDGAWAEFQDAVQPWDELAPGAVDVLTDPSHCQR